MKEFTTAKELHSERQKLQRQLGLPVADKMLTNMKEAFGAVRELRAFKATVEAAERGEAAPVQQKIAEAGGEAHEQAAKAKSRPALNREQCTAVMVGVFREAPRTFAELSDADLFEDTAARITDARLVCPGVRPVDDGPPLRSYALIIRGDRQHALNTTLAALKKK